MSWYHEAVFYHIYPLGAFGAPKTNDGKEAAPRIRQLSGWIPHLRNMGVTALYLGPVFESAAHGYDTIDYSRRTGDWERRRTFLRSSGNCTRRASASCSTASSIT